MIKIFRGGGRGGDTFKTPLPPMNNFCVYPPSVLKCFWKDPLMIPHPHHPTSSIFHCYPPPHPPPLLPPKNFDHTLTSERNFIESSVRWFGREILKLMAQLYWIETAKGNWNKSSHGHRLTKILITLLWKFLY